MKQFATLWSDTPRWARGLFLGNLGYILITGIGFSLIEHGFWDQPWPADILIPLIWPLMRSPMGSDLFLYHAVWCGLGALLVQIFVELKGILIMIALPYGVGIAIIIYALTHFSFSF
jgi:hypothetical protein